MLGPKKEQSVGSNGFAVQSDGNVTINQGLTAEEVRAIAKDSFRSDFFQMLGHAGDIASARAQKVVDDFISRTELENPAALQQADDPDFRYSLFSAQKVHAKVGDDKIEELLVELLVQRSKEPQRNLMQIVLAESVETLGRITNEQIATLSLAFLVRRVVGGCTDLESFATFLDIHIQPFISHAANSQSTFSHLATVGCGAISALENKFISCVAHAYPGLMQVGIPFTDPILKNLSNNARKILAPSEHRDGYVRIGVTTRPQLESISDALSFPDSERELLRNIFEREKITEEQLNEKIINLRPYMRKISAMWDSTEFKKFEPSGVGIAIAHTRIAQIAPNFANLSLWIN